MPDYEYIPGICNIGKGEIRRRQLVAVVGLFFSISALIGFIAGFFGVGGAFLVVPTLILAFGVSAHVTAGTGLIVMLLNSSTAFLVRYDTWGKVDWKIPVVILISAVIVAWFAAEKGTRLKSKSLERGFAGLLLVVGLFTFIETVFL